jgi:hypothetical protein
MSINVDLAWLISLIVTILGGFWAMAKLLLSQSQKHQDAQFESIKGALKQQDEGSRHIERQLMDLKAELPRDYVRREDHTRAIATVQVALDNLRLTIERFMIEGRKP